jgi:4-alpha-glucanotransferase
MPATEGAYVHYRADELYAILCVESQRYEALVVGEDLGTVPDYVRGNMKQRGIKRMYVMQFEVEPSVGNAIHDAPEGFVASLNSHDMRPFGGYWQGLDIDDQVELKLRTEDDAAHARAEREAVRAAIVTFLREKGLLGEHGAELEEVMRAATLHLAASDADIVLLNLEDLWGEAESQNTPGTVDERPNWKRRARLSLEEMRGSAELGELLRKIDEIRRKSQ